MNCDRIEELLPLYADGNISDEERTLVELHVSECSECASLLRYIRSVTATAATWDRVPDDMWPKMDAIRVSVAERIRQESSQSSPRWVRGGLSLATSLMTVLFVAALGGVLYLALSQFQPAGGPQQTSAPTSIATPTATTPVPTPTASPPPSPQSVSFTREQAIAMATLAATQSAPGMDMREVRIDEVTAELTARARFTFDPQPPAWTSQDPETPVWWVLARGYFRWENPIEQTEPAATYEADERYFIYDSRTGEYLGGGVPSARRLSPEPTPPANASVEYRNAHYGFSVALPASWEGFAPITDQWRGDALDPQGEVTLGAEQGPIISLRHPRWTAENPRQDIPITIFTVAQWESLQQGAFHIGAAPTNPSQLGRNNQYVFALPARYNYAFPEGFEEVEEILQGHPLRTFEPAGPAPTAAPTAIRAIPTAAPTAILATPTALPVVTAIPFS